MDQERAGWADPRVAATWLGAAVVLGCGLWLSARGGLSRFDPRAGSAAAAELGREVEWVDQRLNTEQQAAAGSADPQRECRIAALHWQRAVGLAQQEYYHQAGAAATDGDPPEYGPFGRQRLRQDASGDVAAARRAARRALARMPLGPARLRPLWLLSMACSTVGRNQEALGALVELADYKPHQVWVWRLLARTYQACGDPGRQDLAEEQAWRVNSGRPMSQFITSVIHHTPYARPAAHSAGTTPSVSAHNR